MPEPNREGTVTFSLHCDHQAPVRLALVISVPRWLISFLPGPVPIPAGFLPDFLPG
jgi:hypothetical protein